MAYLTREEIRAWQPDAPDSAPLQQAQNLMAKAGLWNDHQQMGRRWPIGCVALEITQRCNLDCTLCYLSEHSEAVHDLPLVEVFRRIAMIRRHYGEHTDVQITGGDPTLRLKGELLAIVRRVRESGLRPTLMTNGIRATRALLEELAAAGLGDVAFHVDTTQQLKGYSTEVALNAVRKKYVERARGLPLAVFFNTTVHQGNFHEIPDLVRFFADNADVVRTASFQPQADTGRGIWGRRDALVTPESVWRQIERGAGTTINPDAVVPGHSRCTRYGMCLVINGRLYDFFDDTAFIGRLHAATAHLQWDRANPGKAVRTFLGWLLGNPRYALPGARWAGRRLWEMKKDLIAGGGRISKLTFVVHNFMDACALEPDRIRACAFKTMTRDGPLSMCLHNAIRDELILQPVAVPAGHARRYWQPLSGELTTLPWTAAATHPETHPLKRLKGRARQKALAGAATTSPPPYTLGADDYPEGG